MPKLLTVWITINCGKLSHGIWSHHFMAKRRGNSGNSGRLYFWGLQDHCRWWFQPWNLKKCLFLGRKFMTNLHSILKSRDITLPTKVHLVKAIVFFAVVMYGCESRTIKKAEHWRIGAFELFCWRRLFRVPWTARRSNQSILKEISPEYSLKGLMLKLKLQYLGHLMHWKRPWCWEGLGAGGEGDNRGWESWKASPTQRTWVWVNPGSWWWTAWCAVQSMQSQRFGHDWATELNWTELTSLEEEQILLVALLWNQMATLSQSLVYQPTLQILDLPGLQRYMSQFFKISLFFSIHLMVVFFWSILTNTDTYRREARFERLWRMLENFLFFSFLFYFLLTYSTHKVNIS